MLGEHPENGVLFLRHGKCGRALAELNGPFREWLPVLF